MATANYGNAQLANANENAELDLNQMMLDLAKLALKLKRQQQQQNAAEGEVDKKHEGVSCDVCGLESFRGYRYIKQKIRNSYHKNEKFKNYFFVSYS